jgi:hypothetical protein
VEVGESARALPGLRVIERAGEALIAFVKKEIALGNEEAVVAAVRIGMGAAVRIGMGEECGHPYTRRDP